MAGNNATYYEYNKGKKYGLRKITIAVSIIYYYRGFSQARLVQACIKGKKGDTDNSALGTNKHHIKYVKTFYEKVI